MNSRCRSFRAVRTFSIEMESLLGGGGSETVAQDLFARVLGQLQIMNASVYLKKLEF